VFRAGNYFGVTTNGTLYCTNANISGTLTASYIEGKDDSISYDNSFIVVPYDYVEDDYTTDYTYSQSVQYSKLYYCHF